jgi:hypothetical protein
MEAPKNTVNTIEINYDKSFNEKRKWQIALRRYVINRNKSIAYAPYFSIHIEGFRNWIECQFDETMNWDNFSTSWQFEHVVPISFFNIENEDELKLCWSYINIRVEKLNSPTKIHKTDVHRTKTYFETLYTYTGIELCSLMIKRILTIELQEALPNQNQLKFLVNNSIDLKEMTDFTAYEFERLNNGDNVNVLLAERELLKRFG